MLATKFFSPLRITSVRQVQNMFRFSTEVKPPKDVKEAFSSQITKTPEGEQKVTEHKPYMYDPVRFQQVNNEKFVQKLEQIERIKKYGDGKKADGYKVPILLALTAAFLYHCWLTIPYNVVYKHATINEYINQRKFYHAIFLSPLSYQNFGQFIIYFPLMIYSFFVIGKHIKQRHMALLYVTNCLVSYAATYYVEKHYKEVKLMKPRPSGGATPLCFASAFLMIEPKHLLFKSKMLPFFVVPVAYYVYELNEYKQNESKEISSEAHFASITYGMLFGLVMRFLITKGKI